MTDEEEFEQVQSETAAHSARETFTPEEHQSLKQAVFSDHFRRLVFADRSYFVLGKYDDGPKEQRLIRTVVDICPVDRTLSCGRSGKELQLSV